ncbi:tryptophan halogenase family protein [Roseateles cellulosilyticus]|uniref:Tryptophan 7-halogenase n=1 Tax=Pelomonas cellulosilytica TaxID=2906762 RepID=A0ABS8Y0U7_9BURK|nr:tryptophan halogenase family protein [Pelomonas sp. P8]MCE4556651.1 tryptophan 7-halogenase [Pelomonas sp. P8]
MSDAAIRRIVIVGGGSAGWMTAAPLGQVFGTQPGGPPNPVGCEIVLVESPDIGTVGVGEATLPSIRHYNDTLGLDNAEFMRKTQATFKLGIEFNDWGHLGNRFFHGFGGFGPAIVNRSSVAHWLRLSRAGGMRSYEEWSVATQMARRNRFAMPDAGPPSAANAYSYAFHFDAGLYAAYLRDYAMARGVKREEGTIVDVSVRPGDGFVTAVTLADGRRIEGDLFIDCSGFRALLIDGVCQVGYHDWTHWLPCDSAQAVPCARVEPLTPYTMSTARSAGWQWRIPLQHRTGNGHVYCSGYTSDEEAGRVLMQHVDGAALGEPRQLRFKTGMRHKIWDRNVVSIGLASGFLEPLESTSLSLVIHGVSALVELFPNRACERHLVQEYNRRMARQYESIRDFIILHYKQTRRDDSDFWRYCAHMSIPETLAHQMAIFRRNGRVAILDRDSFGEDSWLSLFLGLGLTPEGLDPLLAQVDDALLRQHFQRLHVAIAQTVEGMPDHAAYLAHLGADLGADLGVQRGR